MGLIPFTREFSRADVVYYGVHPCGGNLIHLAYLGGSDRGNQLIVDGQEYCFGYWQRGGQGICFIIAVARYMF